jgi:2-oxoglutarate ferredoxin oxidoreductase subunit alpha
MKDFPDINPPIITTPEETPFWPFKRDPETMVRRWALPGSIGLEHRVGGLEKNNNGAVTSDPLVHERMVAERAEKVKRLANFIPEQKVIGKEKGDVLIVGWGGTFGHLYTAVKEFHEQGKSVSLAHFDFIFPLPKNTGEIFSNFKKIIVCELNSGQFANYLRTQYQQFPITNNNKVQGQPFIVKR